MDLPILADDLQRKIGLMVLQLRYPYTSQAPRRRNPRGSASTFETSPALENRVRQSGFFGIDGDWIDYKGLKRRNRKLELATSGRKHPGEPYVPITTGWLMTALRLWIRRAVNAITRRRLYDRQIGNPAPAYGVKYPW